MKKMLPLFLFPFLFLQAQAQRNYSLSTTGHFNFLVGGLGLNNGGFGLDIASNFFAKKKWQLRIEGSIDQFMGSKLNLIEGF